VVLAIISVMLGIGFVAYRNFQVKSDIDTVQESIIQSLRRAQVLAQASREDDDWGVYIQSQEITIFKGNDYSLRDPNFDEATEYSKKVIPSQNYEIIFEKFSGAPQYIGNIELSSKDNTKTISVNSKGLIY
jgi:hypothetical protein